MDNELDERAATSICDGGESRALLLLGGSTQQVVAIEAAKACGYRTVLCDYLTDNPGQYHADSFHLVSTTDRDAVLAVAREEHVQGIVAYASDPAAPTAAYVAEKLGLPTNPLSSVETLSLKYRFRDHLHASNLPSPGSATIGPDAGASDVAALVEKFNFPLVVKPTDSSGSKGVSIIDDVSALADALDAARAQSRNGILIVEEYIDYAFPSVVGGDIFVVDGTVRFWGLMSCLRDAACPLVPVGKRIPVGLSGRQMREVKRVLQGLVDSLGIRFGEMNVEVIIGKGDVPYVLELGARAGGNLIPLQLSDASGIDLVRANVMCAMGDDPGDVSWESDGACYATHVIHSRIDGIYQGYDLSEEAAAACYRAVDYAKPGDKALRFDGANKALGILFFRFESEQKMEDFFANVDIHIHTKVAE